MTSTPSSRPTPGDPDYDALAKEAEMGYDTRTGDSIGKLLLNTTDASVWAHHFKDQFGEVAPDEATMLTWFANAIETGRNAGRKETCSHTDTFEVADNLWCCRDCGFLIQPVDLGDKFVEGFEEGRA
jgi:hypothetical protein